MGEVKNKLKSILILGNIDIKWLTITYTISHRYLKAHMAF
jgi:hypothetical protein